MKRALTAAASGQLMTSATRGVIYRKAGPDRATVSDIDDYAHAASHGYLIGTWG